MSLQVELVSPERVLFSGEAEMVIARTVGGGDIAFLPGHAPFVGALEIATATLHAEGDEHQVAVHGGFIEVTTEAGAPATASDADDGRGGTAGRTVVTILSDVAELRDEIDVGRARAAQERARDRLRATTSDIGAEADLRRAHVRLAAADAL